MTEEYPDIIALGKSQRITLDSLPISIEIYRPEADPQQIFEFVNCEPTSHVSDDHLASDKEARNAAVQEIERVGGAALCRAMTSSDF